MRYAFAALCFVAIGCSKEPQTADVKVTVQNQDVKLDKTAERERDRTDEVGASNSLAAWKKKWLSESGAFTGKSENETTLAKASLRGITLAHKDTTAGKEAATMLAGFDSLPQANRP